MFGKGVRLGDSVTLEELLLAKGVGVGVAVGISEVGVGVGVVELSGADVAVGVGDKVVGVGVGVGVGVAAAGVVAFWLEESDPEGAPELVLAGEEDEGEAVVWFVDFSFAPLPESVLVDDVLDGSVLP